MICSFGARALVLALGCGLMLVPASAQDAQGEATPEEIYEILVGCTAYTTLAAQMAGEADTGPNRDSSARFTRASIMIEPTQSAEVVDNAVMGAVGQMLIRRMDDKQKAQVDADFATLDATCKQIDSNIVIPLLAEIDQQAK